ncbi:MAG: branched-chain amino acid ABC transporter permease [Chloroflexota bacterium]|nr:branched-chain amino acid ABC transporter permease [Chloroflexota bacterium]
MSRESVPGDAQGARARQGSDSLTTGEATLDDPGFPSDPAQRVTKPLPAWEAQLPKIYLVALIVATAGLLWFPRTANAYNITLVLTVLLTVTLATSWNILSGFGGYTSFGHAGFFGIGSYVGALLVFNEVTNWVWASLVAGLATAAVAAIIGYPTLRLRGPYFAITMLGLSELAAIIVTAWDSLTRGGLGIFLPIPRYGDPVRGGSLWRQFRSLVEQNPTFYAMLVLAIVAVIVSYAVGTSRFGLKLLSIRDDEVAAQAMGIDTTKVKMLAFTLSAFFPGAAGAIYARHIGFIDPLTVFAVIWSIRAIATAILGGQGTIIGPIIGAVALTLVSEEVWIRDPNLYQVIFGGLIVLVVLFMPGGLIALMRGWGWLPRSRRI